jgi:phenylacetate-CoA ligase
MKFKSSLPEITFPAIMTGNAAIMMALNHQYNQSQWWSPEELLGAQFEQLTILAEHAMKTTPFHAKRLAKAGFRTGNPMTPEIWRRLPVLTRDDVRDHEDQLKASGYPPSFGPTSEAKSGGSTGIPVRVLKTAVDGLMWQAAHLREFDWNGVDVSLEIANLRGALALLHSLKENSLCFEDAGGWIAPNWGPPASLLWETGRMGVLEPFEPLEQQAAFLMKRRPGHLIMRPAGLRLLLAHFREKGLSLDSLRSVWTMSESVDEGLRELCLEIFGCPVFSSYSCNETGYIALQCPSGTNFHAVSESALVEVIDDSGRPCQPGEVGRVIVTPLHNFAMPLLRYQVGDEAEVGPPCSCGRGLPSLTRIVGRLQDYLTLRSGERKRAALDHYQISGIRAVREFQLVQTSLERAELRIVIAHPLEEAEMEKLDGVMKKLLEGYLEWSVVIVDSLPRTPAGKLRPFLSEI